MEIGYGSQYDNLAEHNGAEGYYPPNPEEFSSGGAQRSTDSIASIEHL
jgi:hypothetical protein